MSPVVCLRRRRVLLTIKGCVHSVLYATVHQMLKYATNHSTCRKILFESQLGDPTTNITPFAGKDQNVCGQCDNCLRNGDSKPTSFESDSEELSPAIIDMKTSGDPLLEASLKSGKELVANYVKGSERVFKDQAIIGMLVCEIIEAAASLDFRLTFQRAVQLCRGRHDDAREQKAVYKLLKRDGFVGISSPELEDIMLELILLGYLKENPVKNCFTTNTYIVPGPESSKLTATDPSTGKKQQRPRIEVSVIQKHP